MVADESSGKLKLDGELAGAVASVQLPLGIGTGDALGMPTGVHHLQRLEAGSGRRLLVLDFAERKLVPTHVIGRHFALRPDHLAFQVGFDDESAAVFPAQLVVAGALRQRIPANAAPFHRRPAATHLNTFTRGKGETRMRK